VTSAAVGLPGSPSTCMSPARPSQTGLPGLIATPAKTGASPSAFRAVREKSRSPTEAPPVTIRISACAIADRAMASIASPSSGTSAMPEIAAPHSVASEAMASDRLSGIDSAPPPARPGRDNSSPVARMKTRGWRHRVSVAASAAAATSIARASSRRPAGSSTAPAAKSDPRGRTWRRPSVAGTQTWSPRRSASSCMITRSVPCGIGAPVKIRTASPGPIAPR
jgi:hypothetical protein